MTNAQYNRKQAIRMFTAGMTPAEIASEFPRAYRVNDGKLSLVYSESATIALHRRDAIARDCELKETDVMVLASAVTKAIAKHKRKKA
jgi:hypothetical protein